MRPPRAGSYLGSMNENVTTREHDTWNRYSGPPAVIYEHHFVPAIGRPFAERAVEATAPQRGERVLDVACGTGIAARVAAEHVGDPRLVAGIDGHPAMIATAREIAPDIDWRQANAEGLPFEDASFDIVLCSLGLQFFADKLRALGEMRRVLRPGGRTAIATAGPTPAPFRALRAILAEHLGDHVGAFVDVVFGLDDTGHLGDLMSAAGFEHVDTSRRTLRLDLDPPADFFWQYALGTPLVEHVDDLDTARRQALEDAVVERWEKYTSDGRFQVDVDLLLGTAVVAT